MNLLPNILAVAEGAQSIATQWESSGAITLKLLSILLLVLLNGLATEFSRRVLRIGPCGEPELPHSEEELRLILAESQKADEVTPLGREIVVNALDLKHRIVRDIMTPRGDVIFLDVEESFD